MTDGAPTSDERARIALDVHQPARVSPVRPMRSRLHSGLRPAKSLSATGATWLISTGRNGNPTAPPALLTRIQQLISCRPRPG